MNHPARMGDWLCALVVLLAMPWNGHAYQTAQEEAERMQSALKTVRRMGKDKLLATLRDTSLQKSNPELLIAAIQRLGMMKDTGAIDDLIPLLTFRRLYPEDKDPHAPIDRDWVADAPHRFPAIEALSLIGRPSLPALVRVIGAADPESLESRCALETIRWVFGLTYTPDPNDTGDPSRRELRAAAKYLAETAKEASSPEAEERLRLAGEKLENWETFKPPH